MRVREDVKIHNCNISRRDSDRFLTCSKIAARTRAMAGFNSVFTRWNVCDYEFPMFVCYREKWMLQDGYVGEFPGVHVA